MSEEKRFSEALRTSEEHFRQLAANIQDVLWMTNADKTRMLYVSPHYEVIWGRSCESLWNAPASWLDAIHPTDRARVESALPTQRVAPWEATYRIVRPDGSERWIRDRSFPVLGEDGRTVRIVGIAEDISRLVVTEMARATRPPTLIATDRLADDARSAGVGGVPSPNPAEVLAVALTERAVALRTTDESGALLRALIESAPDLVIHLDGRGRILFINRLSASFVREEVLGAEWLTFIATDQHEQLRALLKHTLTTGETSDGEILGQGDDGAMLWYWTRIAPVRQSGAVVGAVLICRDITEKKRTEAQLISSDRMASVGILAAGVAHEINNPLASVIANLDLAVHDVAQLSKHAAFPQDLRDELRDARDSAERVRQIVRDLKLFSRNDEEACGPVLVERVMDSTLRMAWNEIRHRARLVKNYGGVPAVDANESRLGQVFLNLIVNAAQAITEGNSEHNEIRVTTAVGVGRQVVVTIADSGPGIPVDVQKQMFTPFFTTKPAGVGTGLGLSICRRIVSSFRGEIFFETELGKGTRFTVRLPMSRLEARAAHEVSPQSKCARSGRILVIDDDVQFGRVLSRILTAEHRVSVVESVELALAMFDAGERFDVILCDLMMPQLTGMDFHWQLRALDAEQAARIVFLTGGAFTPSAREFLGSVPNQRIEKPFDAQALRAVVNGLIR